jgi:hypothetical protein
MFECAQERAEKGEYVKAVQCAAQVIRITATRAEKLAAVKVIVECFDRAYAIDKKLTCAALENTFMNDIAKGTEYWGGVQHINTMCLKQTTVEILGNAPGELASIVVDSVAATFQALGSIKKMFH